MRWFLLLIFVLPLCAQTPQENARKELNQITQRNKECAAGTCLLAYSWEQHLPTVHFYEAQDVQPVKESKSIDVCQHISEIDLRHIQQSGFIPNGNCRINIVYWTCADKSRILLTAEDGERHCIKLN